MASRDKKRLLKLTLAATLGAVLLLGAGSAMARMMGHGPFGAAFGIGARVGHLISELDLTPEQQEYLENVHAIFAEKHENRADKRTAHLQLLIERVDQGPVDPSEVNQSIDEHLEEARLVAYEVASELVAFANSLDDEQRALLVERLETMSERLNEHEGHFRHFGHGRSGKGLGG